MNIFKRIAKNLHHSRAIKSELKPNICFCGKVGYKCDVFDGSSMPKKMTLCKEHIKEKCLEGLFVVL